MTTEAKQNIEKVTDGAKEVANEAKRNPVVDGFARLGYAARGVMYATVGILALQLIFTGHGKLTGREGALETIAQQPFGKILLIVIAVGLFGMLLWGLIQAIADPFRKGTDVNGVFWRLGRVTTGVSYGLLLVPTLRLVMGHNSGAGNETQTAQHAAAGIFTYSWGPWLVGLVGAVLVGFGIVQFYRAWQVDFTAYLKRYEMSGSQRKWANRMGRFGTVAKGVVLGTVGGLALLAALTVDPEKVGGTDRALAVLLQQPYGPWILGLVALGLLAQAVYSFMASFWFRIKEA